MAGQTTHKPFAVDTAAKPKLLDRVRAAARVRHMALSTEKAYVHWMRRFILFHDTRHPTEMGKQEVGDFFTHLAVDGKVSSSTQNQALAALLFLYRVVLQQDFGWLEDVVRAKRPLRTPVVFTHQEAMAVLANLDGVYWLIGRLLYGSGLRVMECLRLRVKDLDFTRLQITVRDTKTGRDRFTMLPRTAAEPLKEHLQEVRKKHDLAMQQGYGGMSPKLAQTLARHSDINLTMNTYTTLEIDDQFTAVEKLPPVPLVGGLQDAESGQPRGG